MTHHLIWPKDAFGIITLCDRRASAARKQGDTAARLAEDATKRARTLARRDLCAECRQTLQLVEGK